MAVPIASAAPASSVSAVAATAAASRWATASREERLLTIEGRSSAGSPSRGCVELLHLEAQQIELTGSGPFVAAEPGQFEVEGPAGGPGPSERTEVDAGEAVERLALHGGSQERLVGVLAVEVDQPLAPLGQVGDGGQAPVDVGPTAPLGRDGPSEDHLVASSSLAASRRHHERPSTHASSAPDRTSTGSARPPTSSSMASTSEGLARPGLAR